MFCTVSNLVLTPCSWDSPNVNHSEALSVWSRPSVRGGGGQWFCGESPSTGCIHLLYVLPHSWACIKRKYSHQGAKNRALKERQGNRLQRNLGKWLISLKCTPSFDRAFKVFIFRSKYWNVYSDMLLGCASKDMDDRKELQSGNENEIRSATRW